MLNPYWSPQQCRRLSIGISEILRELRLARFNRGLRCVRCGSTRVQKWGWFSRRQRYRCRGCGRTFSDLTGTPAAYIKKLERWPLYTLCFAEAMTVRRSAKEVSVHPSTAFRWRHRLAAGLRATDNDRLTGRIELYMWRYPESRKGERGLDRPPRRGTQPMSPIDWPGRWDWLYLACDREGNVVSRILPERTPDEWGIVLKDRIHGVPVLIASVRNFRYGNVPLFAETIGASVRLATGLEHPSHRPDTAVMLYRARLVRWLARFHGVASKYLENYLVWHRRVDEAERSDLPARVLRWPVPP